MGSASLFISYIGTARALINRQRDLIKSGNAGHADPRMTIIDTGPIAGVEVGHFKRS
jgi:hypothetical protein